MRKPIGKVRELKKAKKLRRKLAIRKQIMGTEQRPRVCAIKSNRHLVVQVIDDVKSTTIAAVQTFGKNAVAGKLNREQGKLVGYAVAKKLQSKKIEQAVFDRNGNLYQGVVAAVAEGLREKGIRI